MRYHVNEDFQLETGKAGDPEIVKSGSTFVPATVNYPLHKVEALVKAGTLTLVTDLRPAKKK